MITEAGIKKNLKRSLNIQVYDVLESTNLTAKSLGGSGDPTDMLIVARRQSGGRGRLGRSFFSPDGGLYMSLLLHPKLSAADAVRVTTAAAVAVCRAIESVSCGICEIKWVNDVYMNSRKVCGILTESKLAADGSLSYAVLGIGVNLTPPTDGFPEEIKDRAGAVFDYLPDGADDRLAAEIVNEFYAVYDGGLTDSAYLDDYRRRSFLIGKRIDVMRVHDGEARSATAIAVDDECSLVVRYDDGTSEALSSGDVSVRGV